MEPELPNFEDGADAKNVVPASELKIVLNKAGDFVIEYKGEIIILSSVLAGLWAAYHLRKHRE